MRRLVTIVWFLLTGGDEAHARNRYGACALRQTR
jgi:hypothetical protein